MFWVYFSAGVLLILSIPFLRLLVKRLILRFKIARAAKAAGGRLIPAHAFWLLSRRKGKKCDFYVEMPDKVYAVKLFTVLFKTTNIIFTDQGSYTPVYYIPMFGAWGTVLSLPVPEKAKPLPDYDFKARLPRGAEQKDLYPALLIHPACCEIHRQVELRLIELLYAGDVIRGMHVQSLAGLLKEIKNVSNEKSA